MKHLLFLFASFSFMGVAFSQDNYPVPPSTPNQLFYIQHSNNHNTYVYDVNMHNGNIVSADPISVYRIMYTEGGEKKELTRIQRKLAYGTILLESQPNLFKLRLEADPRMSFYLTTIKGNIRAYVILNQQKIYLDKLFVQLKPSLLNTNTEVEYVLFYGKNYQTDEAVIEKMVFD
jgi:hypothetical protein